MVRAAGEQPASGADGQRRLDAHPAARAAARAPAADARREGPRGAVGAAAHGAPLAGGHPPRLPRPGRARARPGRGRGRRAGLLRSTGRARSRWGRPRSSPPSPARRRGWTPGGIPRGRRGRCREVLGRMRRAGRLDAERARIAAAADLDLVPARPPVRRATSGGRTSPASWSRSGSAARWRSGPRSTRRSSATWSSRCARSSPPTRASARRRCSSSTTPRARSWPTSARRTSSTTPREGQNDGVRARRQPGSALKPFAYGLALAQRLDPGLGAERRGPGGGDPRRRAGSPGTTTGGQHGPVRLRAALANSYNVPAVELTDALGPERVLEVLRAGGLQLARGERRALRGRAGARATATCRSGSSPAPTAASPGAEWSSRSAWCARRTAPRRRAARRPAPSSTPRRFLPADAVALLTDVLSDEGARAPAFGLDNALRLPFPGGGQDRHQPRLRGQLDRGLHPRAHGGGLGGELRRPADAAGLGHHRRRAALRPGDAPGDGRAASRRRWSTAARFEPGPHLPALGAPRRRGLPRHRTRRSSSPGPRRPSPARCTGWSEGRPVLDARPALCRPGPARGPRRRGRWPPPGRAPGRPSDAARRRRVPPRGRDPAPSQTIPVRVRGAAELRVDGAPVPVDALGRTRVPLLPGKHRLELVRTGAPATVQRVEIQIRGGAVTQRRGPQEPATTAGPPTVCRGPACRRQWGGASPSGSTATPRGAPRPRPGPRPTRPGRCASRRAPTR